jgi:hypothetical protein
MSKPGTVSTFRSVFRMSLHDKPKPTGTIDIDVALAHKHSNNHRADLVSSDKCGCFYCLEVYSVDSIEEWTDFFDGVGDTAICPHCGVDSVIGSCSGFPIELWFLTRMYARWFE